MTDRAPQPKNYRPEPSFAPTEETKKILADAMDEAHAWLVAKYEAGVMYTYGFFSAKHLGEGQFYLMTTKDHEGAELDGGQSYRLTVPPEAPVRLYWGHRV